MISLASSDLKMPFFCDVCMSIWLPILWFMCMGYFRARLSAVLLFNLRVTHICFVPDLFFQFLLMRVNGNDMKKVKNQNICEHLSRKG